MKLSLIISIYNQTEVLQKVLAGVARQRRTPNEILFADDGSGVPTRQVIEAFAARSRLPIRHVWHADDGFRKTVILNQAVAVAQGDYLVFTDGDCVPILGLSPIILPSRNRVVGCKAAAVLWASHSFRSLRQGGLRCGSGC